jgi:hypothetical protein
LVEQGLECVVIAPVNDRDAGARAGERLGGIETSEAGTDDHHARGKLVRHLADLRSTL